MFLIARYRQPLTNSFQGKLCCENRCEDCCWISWIIVALWCSVNAFLLLDGEWGRWVVGAFLLLVALGLAFCYFMRILYKSSQKKSMKKAKRIDRATNSVAIIRIEPGSEQKNDAPDAGTARDDPPPYQTVQI